MSKVNGATGADSSRRDFLKTTAAAAGTALAGQLSLAPAVHAAGSDVIKVGLIGCGGRGTGAAEQCLRADPHVKLVAVGDAFEDRARGVLNHLEAGGKQIDVGNRVYVGLDAYRKVIADVDLVILATPPGFRPQHLQAAVEAGKHIFTEKPVAVDGPGIRQVLEVYQKAREKNLAIVAGTQRRHQTAYREAMRRVHDGAIGQIEAGRCYWNQGALWHRNREAGMSDLTWQLRNWLYFTWLSGDHIVEQHVHNLDVINWALQAHPVRAVGMGGRQVRTGKEFGHIYDHFAIDYEYPNGVHVLSMCRQIPDTTQNVSEAVVGTRGSCTTVDRVQYVIKGENPWSFPPESDNSPYDQEHVDLIRSIRAGKPLNELKQVAESTLTAILGRLTAYTGKVVSWEQALHSKWNLMPAQLAWDMKLPVPPVAMPGKTKLV
jgi:predicted dehydrogenase